jgi:hypothetical protein
VRYLCLIYWNEEELFSLPAAEMNVLNAAHLEFNEGLRKSGHYIEAEALEPARASTCVRVRKGKVAVTDGPFTEAKELVAGFYLIEARDLDEAVQLASRIPSASRAVVEVRPVRQLIIDATD